MAQIMSVRLSRSDAAPWGFRLQGGKDFGAPLLIQKVNGGSPAERAGLQAGDAVIKVNNTEVFNLRHKDAQDNIVRAGNSFEITVQRGGNTWKPAVTPVGPQPVKAQAPGQVTPVTKTSLAHNKQPASPIGTGHNYTPVPFGQQQMNGNGVDPVKSIVNKQYNSPVGIYSEETIAETLSAQAEVLAGGVLGVNFKKNEKNYDPANSEVFKMLNEIANEPRTPEPEAPAPAFERVAPAPAPSAVPFSVAGLRHVTAPEPRPALADDQKTVLPPGQNICGECERLVVGVFVRIKDKNLHVECFKCATCGTSLKNVGYYNINNKLYCDVHAKLVARQHPPAPNLEPVTVPPGGQKPAGAISAALANRGPMSAPAPAQPPSMFNRGPAAAPAPAQPSMFNRGPAAGPAPGSPQPSNFAPVPFHAPGGFAGVKPSFNAAAPAPMPSSPVAAPFASSPMAAPFTTPAKPAPASGKFVWPPKPPTEENSASSTATPLYIPPGPLNQSAAIISLFDQSADAVPNSQQRRLSQPLPVPQIQPFPQPYADFIAHQPVARPNSAYQYTPKPLGTNEARPKSAFAAPIKSKPPQSDASFQPIPHKVVFEGDVQYCDTDEISSMVSFEQENKNAHRKKYSVCSQEVMGITEQTLLSSSVEQLSESIDTAILVTALTGRPESPVPMDHVNQDIPMFDDVVAKQNATQRRYSLKSAPKEKPHQELDDMTHKDEKELVVALKNVIETQSETIEEIHQQTEKIAEEFLKQSVSTIEQTNPLPAVHSETTKPQPWQSQLVTALTTAPDRPYSPLPTAPDVPAQPTVSPRPTTLPVSYRQLPQPTERFVPITQDDSTLLPILVSEPEHSSFITALTIAPNQPVCPLPLPMEPLPMKPVPFPEQTQPYQPPTRSETCPSPMVSALTVAPQRPYSPFPVTKAPTSVMDSIQDMKANIDVGEPFNLPTPSHYSSMTSALTIAPERPYSPLNVTQAPTVTTTSPPKETKPEVSFKIVPPKIVGDLQATVFKPTAVKETIQQVTQNEENIEPEPPKSFPPVSEELKKISEPPKLKPVIKVEEVNTTLAKEAKDTSKVVKKSQESTKKVVIKENKEVTSNALHLHRQTQQRPITPKMPRPITPSMITGLTKPSAIPYYQQNISDGDFPCRSPRPTTPTLNCPMTVPRPATPGVKGEARSMTPVPHKQLQMVRSLTPVNKCAENLGTPGQNQQQAVCSMTSQQTPQVVVTKNTRVTEEFESFHKESTKVIEKSGSSQKCILESLNTSAVSDQSILLNKEVTAIMDGNIASNKTSSFEASKCAAQSQEITYDSQHNIQPLQTQQQTNSLQVQPIIKEGFISLEESQRASPLPFPNISLPEGMLYEVVDNKALYTSGSKKQVFKINQPIQVGQPSESASQFKIQAPTHKQPFIQMMAPKFEPQETSRPFVPSTPAQSQNNSASTQLQSNIESQQPLGQTKFQPLAPQPILSVSNHIQAPTATLPVNIANSQQLNGNIPQTMASKPIMSTGINSFTPKSSGNGFQDFNPKSAAVEPAPVPVRKASLSVVSRRLSSDLAFKNVVPSPSVAPVSTVTQGTPRRESQGILKHTQDVVPKTVAPGIPGLMDPCTTPPNAGGGSGAKGASFAGSSAPVRGRGVLNQAMGPGARQALCGQCHGQIRGPFVTALGKIWCPEHFVCVNAQCKRQLADIGFVEEKGQLYCEYCFEQFIAPPCNKCSAKIKGDCLNAIGKTFHPECFVCCYCNKLFGNNPFFLEDGMAYCQADWNELFTTKCFACGFPIEAGDRWVEALNNNYHSQCFNCTSCKKNLEGQSFFAKSGRPFCKAHAR